MSFLNHSLGIDLRDNKLRIAHVFKGALGGYRLLHHLILPLPFQVHDAGGTVLLDGSHNYQEMLVEEVSDFCRQYQIRPKTVVLGLPQRELIVRKLQLPKAEEKDLRALLDYEIERHIPYPKENVYYDFLTLGGNKTSLEVLLFAAPKERVDFYVNLLEQAGLKCNIVRSSLLGAYHLLALSNLLNQKKTDGSQECLAVEVGDREVDLTLFQGGKPVIFRSFQRPEKQQPAAVFNKHFSKRSLGDNGLVLRLLEEKLIKHDGENPDYAFFAETIENEHQLKYLLEQTGISELEPILAIWRQTRSGSAIEEPGQHEELAERIANEVNLLCQSLAKGGILPKLSRIILWGREEQEISPILEQFLEIPVQRFNSMDKVKSSVEGKPDGVEIKAALGLGMQVLTEGAHSLNLIPAAAEEKKTGRILAIFLMVALGISVIANVASYFLREQMILSKVLQEQAELRPRVAAIQKLQEQYKIYDKQFGALDSFEKGSITTLDMLKELTKLLPRDVWLDTVEMEEGEITISGHAPSASSIVLVLEASPYFENTKFAAPVTSREGEQERFKIKMKLEGKEG